MPYLLAALKIWSIDAYHAVFCQENILLGSISQHNVYKCSIMLLTKLIIFRDIHSVQLNAYAFIQIEEGSLYLFVIFGLCINKLTDCSNLFFPK